MINRNRWIQFAAVLGLAPITGAAVQTPEQLANAQGLITNSHLFEYYYKPGAITVGQTLDGDIVGAGGGSPKASVTWFKYVADGQTGVVFDLFGSNFGFGGGGVLSGGPDGELALYNSLGQLVATSESPRTPLAGDSNVQPTVLDGQPPLPTAPNNLYRQPKDPTLPAYRLIGGTTWAVGNGQGLSQLAFVKNPEANPDPAGLADWDEYGILPAGEYFLAVTGWQTRFAGNERDRGTVDGDGISKFDVDAASYGGRTASFETPFGLLSIHPHSGTYTLNVRLPGDLDLNGVVDEHDLQLLQAKIDEFAPYDGIPPEAFDNGAWVGLPSNIFDPSTELQRFDLTANGRIDHNDLLQFGRWTGISVPEPTTLGSIAMATAVLLRRRRREGIGREPTHR